MRLIGFDNQIRLAKLPAFSECGWRRSRGRVAFGRSLRDPLGNRGDLRVSQALRVGEIAIARLRRPGRHAAPREIGNLAGVFLYVGIAEQGERAGLAGTMARSAMLIDDRRDVVSEGDRPRGRHECRQKITEKEIRFHAALHSTSAR